MATTTHMTARPQTISSSRQRHKSGFLGSSTTMRLSVVVATLLLLFVSPKARAFAPLTTTPTATTRKSSSSLVKTKAMSPPPAAALRGLTTSALFAVAWEDVVYNAQSVASNWASLSLQQDPSNLVTSLPIMYGAGLLTSFSPCVWGLLPLTMSYISNAAGERADQQTTLPTVAFAAGLAVVFCTLGVTAAQLGGVFGSTAGGSTDNELNLIGIFSNTICFLMGLQLLELIKVPLPSFDFVRDKINPNTMSANSNNSNQPILLDSSGQILNKAKHDDSERQEQGSLFRTFLLGGSSALVASPCATPVLTSILAFVAKTQNPVLGGALLLGYTLGYSTPLLLLASTGGQALVDLRKRQSQGGFYAVVAPWVTPLTGGILLWYGTNGVLTALLGDPSLAGLQILE